MPVRRNDWLWIAIGSFAAALVTLALLAYPKPTAAVLGGAILLAIGMRAGRANAVGVGVLGALASAILIPAGLVGTGQLSSILGLVIGGAWLLWFHVIFQRPLRSSGYFRWFGVLIGLDVVGSAMSGYWDQFSLVVLGFVLLVGWSSGALEDKERTLVFRGLTCLSLFEAILCSYEAFIHKMPLLAPKPYGLNPFVADAIRGQGTLGHPLVAGLVILVGMCLVLGSRMRVLPKLFLLAILLVGNLATGSSSLIVAAGAVIVFRLFGGGSVGARVMKTLIALPAIVWLMGNPQIFDPVAQGLTGQDSIHRLYTIEAIPRLINLRPWQEAIFGSGPASIPALYSSNVMINDYFPSIDNQFVRELATGGLIGAAVLLVLLAVVAFRAKGQVWLTLAGISIMFLSFDVLAWAATGAVFAVMIAQVRKPELGRGGLDEPRGTEKVLLLERH